MFLASVKNRHPFFFLYFFFQSDIFSEIVPMFYDFDSLWMYFVFLCGILLRLNFGLENLYNFWTIFCIKNEIKGKV